jgi:hypothetical protein
MILTQLFDYTFGMSWPADEDITASFHQRRRRC